MAVGIFAIFGCLVLNPFKVGGLDFSTIILSHSYKLIPNLFTIVQSDNRVSKTTGVLSDLIHCHYINSTFHSS